MSPSGKARASQARMRGFESRHPLQKKLRPVFSSELCSYVAVHLETGFLLHGPRLCRPCQGYTQMSVRPCLRSSITGFSPLPSLEVSRFFHRICPVLAIRQSRKTKILASLQLFCDCGLFFVPSERKRATAQPITCVFASQSAIRHPTTVPNRKKIAIQADFLFLGSRDRPQIGAV